MNCFLTGINGQLGYDLAQELARRGRRVLGCGTRAEGPRFEGAALPPDSVRYIRLDLRDEEAVRACFEAERPEAVFHCAAWTAVDAAEAPENREAVFAVNAEATRRLAEAARDAGAKLVYISTDYVFDGGGETPWDPDCEDYRPLNVYGESKLAGERAVRELLTRFFIVRTSWVFGAAGKNFVKTMLRLGRTHDSLRVVCDQIGRPTYTRDLARLLADLAETERCGVYHASNEGDYVSWYGFTKEIFRQCSLGTEVLPVATADYGAAAARRPLNSRLDCSKLAAAGFEPLPPWREALSRFLKEIGEG